VAPLGECNFAPVKILAPCWTPPRAINPNQSSHLASEIGPARGWDRCHRCQRRRRFCRENFLLQSVALCDNPAVVCAVEQGGFQARFQPTQPSRNIDGRCCAGRPPDIPRHRLSRVVTGQRRQEVAPRFASAMSGLESISSDLECDHDGALEPEPRYRVKLNTGWQRTTI